MTDERNNVLSLDEAGLLYRVRVLVEHPTEILDPITQLTSVTPQISCKKGDPRVIPGGTAVRGKHPASAWSWSQDIRNSRNFSRGVRDTLDVLLPAYDFIKKVRSTGGSATLIVELEGERNIGAVVAAEDLRRLADAGFDLGIEVYPEGL